MHVRCERNYGTGMVLNFLVSGDLIVISDLKTNCRVIRDWKKLPVVALFLFQNNVPVSVVNKFLPCLTVNICNREPDAAEPVGLARFAL
jgi:hypothetical protein